MATQLLRPPEATTPPKCWRRESNTPDQLSARLQDLHAEDGAETVTFGPGPLGLSLALGYYEDGRAYVRVDDVQRGSKALGAGVGPGDELAAVNGRHAVR